MYISSMQIRFGHNYVWMGLALLCSLFACSSQQDQTDIPTESTSYILPEKVDFNFHIKPILSDRCFNCHGPDGNKREAGLSLHTENGLFAGSEQDSTVKIITPGNLEASLLYQRITAADPAHLMPPASSNLFLSEEEVALIGKWIEQGSEWKPHWAFTPPTLPEPPAVKAANHAVNPIDHFILANLETQGLNPAPEAKPERLLRRLSLDVRGIPPTPEEVQNFLKDPSPVAYAQKVDEYLASTDHAERLTVWWLDIARYADTHGYQDDLEREMWPWRDWVIHAFQENMPYDQFVTWQLAGDLLPDANLETILATGFNRNHKITQEGGVIDEEFLVDYVADRTVTTFTAFQGVTMECARCHDHKYDPIFQQDFYAAFDFFNQVPEKGRVDYGQHPEPTLAIDQAKVEEILDFIEAPDSVFPVHPMVMKDEQNLRTTHILERGQYDLPGKEVQASTPAAILAFPETLPQNRLGLAQWLFDPENPLTARVVVNRVWAMYFQRGIVATPDDFGNQGALPSHPELLDWLALTLMEKAWDLREMERMILLSSTYKQDSRPSKEQEQLDPENIYLAHAPAFRLSAEMLRDQALAVSGLLVRKTGGPPVKPYQPPGLWKEKTSGGGYVEYVPGKGEDLYRKSMYTYWKRTVPPPAMLVFDAPTRDICTVSRQNTNTPLQALVLLNDPQYIEAARVLAENLGGETSVENQIQSAFYRIVCRPPSTEETTVLSTLYQTELERYTASTALADSLLAIGEKPVQSTAAKPELAALTIVTSTIFNLNEAVVRQ